MIKENYLEPPSLLPHTYRSAKLYIGQICQPIFHLEHSSFLPPPLLVSTHFEQPMGARVHTVHIYCQLFFCRLLSPPMGDGQPLMLDQRFFQESLQGGFFIGKTRILNLLFRKVTCSYYPYPANRERLTRFSTLDFFISQLLFVL